MFYNLFDSHTHSRHSADAYHAVAFMAETAIEKELRGFAVTDHCEGDFFDERGYAARIMHSAISVAKARAAFDHQIVITFGIEVAHVFDDMAAIDDIFRRHHLDFVIGAAHKTSYENFEFFNCMDYKSMPAEKLRKYITSYYEDILKLIEWGNFDVLAHLSIPVRYPKLYSGIDVDLTEYKEQIDEVLRLAVQKGKGIEINTSGLRSAIGDTLPPMWVLKRFRELGGEIVTLGSDAHRAEDMGEGLDYAMQMLLDAGYEYFAFFRNREPVMLKII